MIFTNCWFPTARPYQTGPGFAAYILRCHSGGASVNLWNHVHWTLKPLPLHCKDSAVCLCSIMFSDLPTNQLQNNANTSNNLKSSPCATYVVAFRFRHRICYPGKLLSPSLSTHSVAKIAHSDSGRFTAKGNESLFQMCTSGYIYFLPFLDQVLVFYNG